MDDFWGYAAVFIGLFIAVILAVLDDDAPTSSGNQPAEKSSGSFLLPLCVGLLLFGTLRKKDE